MVMVLTKVTTACILLVFLCAAWLSTARLNPAGTEEVNGISSTKDHGVASATINSIKEKSLDAIIAGNSKKLMSVKQVIRKRGNVANSSRSGKRSLRTRLSGDIGGGFMSFTADYHSPRHHPPKNNK